MGIDLRGKSVRASIFDIELAFDECTRKEKGKGNCDKVTGTALSKLKNPSIAQPARWHTRLCKL